VAGTSHDVYNTQWQVQDYGICRVTAGISTAESGRVQSKVSGVDPFTDEVFGPDLARDTTREVAAALFVGTLTAEPAKRKYLRLLDPQYASAPPTDGSDYQFSKGLFKGIVHREFTAGALDGALDDEDPAVVPFSFLLHEEGHVKSNGTGLRVSREEHTANHDALAAVNSPVCLSRTTAVEWNGCIGKQQVQNSDGSTTSLPGTCQTSRSPATITAIDQLRCARSRYAYNGGCHFLQDAGPLLDSPADSPGVDPYLDVHFRTDGAEVDVSLLTRLSFSVARQHNGLNVERGGEGFDVVLTGLVDGEPTGACVNLAPYLYANGGKIGKAPANYLSNAMVAESNLKYTSLWQLTDQGNKTNLAADLGMFNSAPVVRSAKSLTVPINKVFYPTPLTVTIPLAELGITKSATGVKILLTAAGVGSGALLFGPMQVM